MGSAARSGWPVRSWTAGVVAAVLGAAGLVAAAGPAQADSITALTNRQFAQLVVDPVHQLVFLSGGDHTTSVEVRGFDGTGKGLVALGTDAGGKGMAVAPDGSAVYVALTQAGTVKRISTTTRAVTATYSLGAVCPSWLAFGGATLYVGYGCGANHGAVAPLDVTAATPHLGTALVTGLASAPAVSGDRAGHWLAALAGQATPRRIVRFDLTQAPPASAGVDLAGNCTQVAVEPTAGDVLTPCEPGPLPAAAVQAYALADLSATTVYPAPSWGAAVAVSDVAVATGAEPSTPDILVMPRHSTTPARAISFVNSGGIERTLVANSLALTPNASHLFAVSTTGASLVLHVYVNPLAAASTMSLSAPTTAARGSAVTLTGRLTGTWNPGAGVTVAVKKVDLAGTHALASVTTDSTGAFTVHDTPTIGGSNSYTVSYAGTAQRQPASATRVVAVSRLTPALTIATNYTTYTYNAKATVTVHLGPTFNGRSVLVYAQPLDKPKVLLAKGTVNAAGNFVVHPAVTRRVTFTATFPGDYRYAPRSVARSVIARAAVGTVAKRWYGTSNGYYLYRTSVNPLIVGHFSPNLANRCAKFTAQRFSAGAWRTWATTPDCVVIDSASNAAAELLGSHPRGYRFRMRAEFIGSQENAAKNGAWKYFRFP